MTVLRCANDESGMSFRRVAMNLPVACVAMKGCGLRGLAAAGCGRFVGTLPVRAVNLAGRFFGRLGLGQNDGVALRER